jgi:hypothetical protein
MGTYRQPSQIIDKSFNTLNQGLQNVNQQISNELRFQRAQEIARAKEAKKEQEKKDKELKDLRDRQQAAVDGYQVNIDNWENINQRKTENWEKEDVTVTNQIKNNSKILLDIMSNHEPGSDEYREAERGLKNMITQYPVMASLFNQESEQTDSAFVNGVQIGENEDGAILNSNDPLQSVKLHMLRDLKTGRNPERFQVLSLPSGQVFRYEDADGTVFETGYQDYIDFRENGGNLIDTVNGEEYNTFMDGIWNKTLKKTYDTLSTKITSYREGIRNGDPVNFKDVEVSYTQANKNLDNTLDNWVDGGGSVSQSTWQMLGGSGVYNPEKNKEQLKTYLKTKVKDRFTTQEDKYTLSEQEIIKGGGSGNGKDEEVEVVSYDTIISVATAFEKALKNPNRVISTGEEVKPGDIESGKAQRLSETESKLKVKLTNDLKSRFEGSGFATGSGTKIIQDIKIKYKDGKLLFFPQVNYAAAGGDEDLKTLKEYSSGIPLTSERLLKFEKQIKQIAKDSVVSTGVGAKFNQ